MNKKQINDFFGGHTCIDTDDVVACKKQLNALYGAQPRKKDYTDYNLLGQCKGVRYFDKNLVADYSTVMTFIPTPYPKEFKGKFEKGFNKAIEEIRLRIKEYYEGRE